MKKLNLAVAAGALALLLVVPRPILADVQFGIKGGGNMANFIGADVQNMDLGMLSSKIGFCAGAFVAFNLGSVVTIQLEGLYTMKGAKETYSDGTDTYIGKLMFDYIEVPLLLKLRIPTPLVSPFVFAGPSVGFKLSSKIKTIINGVSETTPVTDLKSFDYGGIVGAGLNVGRHFQLDVRYSLGLQRIIQTVQGQIPVDLKNGVWAATLGIAF